MAEDIVVSWNSTDDFGIGLWLMGTALLQHLGDIPADQTNPLVRPALAIAEALNQSSDAHNAALRAFRSAGVVEPWAAFRVEDKDGNEVKFPIRITGELDHHATS